MSNISRIREALRETNCDAMLVTNQISRLFATGFSSSAGALLVTESSAWFYTDSRYIEAAEAAIKDAEVILVGGNDKLTDVVCARANDISVRAIGFEDGNVSFASHKNCPAIGNIDSRLYNHDLNNIADTADRCHRNSAEAAKKNPRTGTRNRYDDDYRPAFYPNFDRGSGQNHESPNGKRRRF